MMNSLLFSTKRGSKYLTGAMDEQISDTPSIGAYLYLIGQTFAFYVQFCLISTTVIVRIIVVDYSANYVMLIT